MTRITISRRRHHPAVLLLMLLAGLLIFEMAIDALHYPVFLVLPAAGWLACRWWYRRSASQLPAPPKPLHLLLGTPDPQLVDDLRRHIAKLEGDAARRERLVEDLEDAAARPIEAIIASYRKAQRQYGPAAVGRTTGARP